MGAIGQAAGGASVAELARASFDVVVVGGGIYGALAHLEASRAGLRSVLVERSDFGAATSANSLRIVHGGLRYLQTLNVARSVESTRERHWYLRSLPQLVRPLPCLLPIYGRGRRRASVLKLGLAVNDAISAAARRFDASGADVPRGRLLDASSVLAIAPSIPARGLEGGAVWHDLALRCPGRVIAEALKWAADLGGVAANYTAACRLLAAHGRVHGVAVAAVDGGATAELRARAVINAAGPWADELAASDERVSPLVAAWNVLLDRPALADHAIALEDPAQPRAALKFATTLGGRLLIGTGYAPVRGSCESAAGVAEEGLDAFLAAVNRCLPALEITARDVVRVFSGVLPAAAPGSAVPRARNELVTAGPRGFVTISGTKFTTARCAALQAIAALRRDARWRAPARSGAYPAPSASVADGLFGDEWTLQDLEARRRSLVEIIAHEAVEHLDDLVLRRTTLGDQPARALAAGRELCSLDERWRREPEREMARLTACLGRPRGAWAANRPGLAGAVARTA